MARKEIEAITENLQQAIDLMKQHGADYAQASLNTHQETSVKVLNGVVENLEASKPMSLSLSMRKGDKSESMSLNSRHVSDLKDAVAQLSSAVSRMPDNIYDRPVESSRLSTRRDQRGLDLIDHRRPALTAMIDDARLMEQVALAVTGVSLSKGASASWYRALAVSLDSRGDRFISERTGASRGIAVIARRDTDQRTGGEGHSAVYYDDLKAARDIGLIAGTEAVQALHPGRAPTGALPVVFHRDIGTSLLGHFAAAINGASIRKKTSFLCDAMQQAVFAPGVRIFDNPHLKRGPASKNYSGSGMAALPMNVVEDGVLQTWLMGMEDARRLGLENAAHIRGHSNLTIEPGVISPDDLISDIKQGLFVTGLMGQGIDLTSGQYSRAATGFIIENGRIDYSRPVSNASISGNLKDMFQQMSVANDLDRWRGAMAVPTMRIDGMSLS
ncbi:MAG TPA: TldD/PmbA family protein [Micavibrio sp.]